MFKVKLFLLSLFVILAVSGLVYFFAQRGEYRPSRRSEADAAVNQAKYLFKLKKERGEDLSNGPCLSNALMPNWVADIAHRPRLPIDDLPENQCSAYKEGRAQHFVELDTQGNVIRAQ